MKSTVYFVLFSFVYFFAHSNCISQTGVALPMLIETSNARTSGMGNTGTAVANDIHATFLNPGGLGFLKSGVMPKFNLLNITTDLEIPFFEANYSFSELPLYSDNDKSFNELMIGLYIKPLNGMFVLDYSFEGIGVMTRTAENGQVLGKFEPNEFYLGLAYGTSIGDDFGIGVKIKYIESNISPENHNNLVKEASGSGWAFDIGVLWKPELSTDTNSFFGKKFFSAGINLQNIGNNIEYLRESELLPSVLRFGVAFKPNIDPNHKLTFAIDAVKLLSNRVNISTGNSPSQLNTSIGLGVEYWLMRTFALRTGYYTEPAALGNREYITFGSSIRFFILQGDISYNYSSSDTKYLTNILKFNIKVGC